MLCQSKAIPWATAQKHSNYHYDHVCWVYRSFHEKPMQMNWHEKRQVIKKSRHDCRSCWMWHQNTLMKLIRVLTVVRALFPVKRQKVYPFCVGFQSTSTGLQWSWAFFAHLVSRIEIHLLSITRERDREREEKTSPYKDNKQQIMCCTALEHDANRIWNSSIMYPFHIFTLKQPSKGHSVELI